MHCFVISFHKCNLEYGATTGCFSSLKLSSAWNPFSVEKKKKQPKNKNQANKKPKQKKAGKSRVHV